MAGKAAARIARVPVYQQIRRDLIARIEKGEWRPGERIPKELDLCREYGVALGTLRRATDALVADEILSRREGVGTFVKTFQWGGYWNQFMIYKGLNGRMRGSVWKLAVFETAKAEPEIAAKLQVEPGEPMIRLVRHWYEGGEAQENLVSACESLLVARFFPQMRLEDFRDKYRPGDSFYRFLDREYGVVVASQKVEVRYEEVSVELARLLRVPYPFHVLRTECVTLSNTRRPVELRINRGLVTNTKVCFDVP